MSHELIGNIAGITIPEWTVRRDLKAVLAPQIDRSGVGHNWQTIDHDDIPANIVEEIEGEIIDGKQGSCADFVASNGMHYRWS